MMPSCARAIRRTAHALLPTLLRVGLCLDLVARGTAVAVRVGAHSIGNHAPLGNDTAGAGHPRAHGLHDGGCMEGAWVCACVPRDMPVAHVQGRYTCTFSTKSLLSWSLMP